VFRPKAEEFIVTIENDIWVKFNDTMRAFSPVTDQHIKITIKGPRSDYELNFIAQFVNNTHLFIDTTIMDRLWAKERIFIDWLTPAEF
jgi:hypothetical protein